MKRYIVEVMPLTPVHIGTGQEVGPLEYAVLKHNDESSLYLRFSTDRIIAEMDKDSKKMLLTHIENNELKKIAGILSKTVRIDQAQYTMPASESVAHAYRNKIESIENQLIVQEMYRDMRTVSPVIPGSSIKGALRTAVINEIVTAKNPQHIQAKYFENDVLAYDDAKNDPFRALRITDCFLSGTKNQFVGQIFNYKADFINIQIFQEQLSGVLSSGNTKGKCELVVDEALQSIGKDLRYGKYVWKSLKTIITVPELLLSCNSFYKNHLTEEFNKFYKTCNHENLSNTAESLNNIVEDIKAENNECLIRLGRYSHVENVTVDKYRRPFNKKYGTTRFISEKSYPMGWVKLKFTETN